MKKSEKSSPEHFKKISEKVKTKAGGPEKENSAGSTLSPYISDLEDYAKNSQNTAVDIDKRVQIVLFELNNEYFGLYGRDVKAIVNQEQVFFVPGVPMTILGIVNIRGDVESVIDIKKILEIPASDEARVNGKIVIAHSGEYRCGILVDELIEVSDIQEIIIHPVETAIKRSFKDIVLAEFSFKGKLVFLLDMSKIMEKVLL